MEDITDSPYRSVCKHFGADVVVSEFISSEGLIRDAEKSLEKLHFGEDERPLGIQIFGHDPRSMVLAAEMAAGASPDFIDLNFGCPVKKVVRKGAGAALLRDPKKMTEITRAVVKAVTLPVTVKTRLGWDSGDLPIVELSEQLQDVGIRSIAIHGRTAVQVYGGRADWSLIAEVKRNPRMRIPVVGNGDITNPLVARERLEQTGVDGLMIGRAATGNPWIFRDIRSYLDSGFIPPQPKLEERIPVLMQHLVQSVHEKGEQKAIREFRKFYSGYLRGLPSMKTAKMALMQAPDLQSVEKILLHLPTRAAE